MKGADGEKINRPADSTEVRLVPEASVWQSCAERASPKTKTAAEPNHGRDTTEASTDENCNETQVQLKGMPKLLRSSGITALAN